MNGFQARAIMKLSQINCLKFRGGGTGNTNYNFALKSYFLVYSKNEFRSCIL